jgi:hypothetical protein
LTHTVPRTAARWRSARGARVDDRGEAILGRVGELDRLGLVLERLDGEHRAEDLPLHDLGVVRARLDESRLVPEAANLGSPPPADDPVAALARTLDEALDAGEVVG